MASDSKTKEKEEEEMKLDCRVQWKYWGLGAGIYWGKRHMIQAVIGPIFLELRT